MVVLTSSNYYSRYRLPLFLTLAVVESARPTLASISTMVAIAHAGGFDNDGDNIRCGNT